MKDLARWASVAISLLGSVGAVFVSWGSLTTQVEDTRAAVLRLEARMDGLTVMLAQRGLVAQNAAAGEPGRE